MIILVVQILLSTVWGKSESLLFRLVSVLFPRLDKQRSTVAIIYLVTGRKQSTK